MVAVSADIAASSVLADEWHAECRAGPELAPPFRAWRPNCPVSERRTPKLGCSLPPAGYEHPAVCREMTFVPPRRPPPLRGASSRPGSARGQRHHQWSSGICLTDTRLPGAAAATPARSPARRRSADQIKPSPDFWSVLLISSSIYSVSGTARCFCCWWYSSKSTFSAVYSLLQRCRLHWHQSRANST